MKYSVYLGWLGVLGILFFFTNFVWESWHAVWLYGDTGIAAITDLRGFVGLITYVSVIDALILSAMVLSGSFLFRNATWWRSLSLQKGLFIILFLIPIAIVIEYRAVFLQSRWAYNILMPQLFGIGLSPLLQLPFTAWVSFGLLDNKWAKE